MESKQEVIPELSEENMSQSQASSYIESNKPPKASMMKPVEKKVEKQLPMPPCPGGFQNVMQVYYRIDQEELEKRGLGHKSELEKESGCLTNLHQFSMLQRFR